MSASTSSSSTPARAARARACSSRASLVSKPVDAMAGQRQRDRQAPAAAARIEHRPAPGRGLQQFRYAERLHRGTLARSYDGLRWARRSLAGAVG